MSVIKNPILLPLQSIIGITPTPKPVVVDDENVSLVLPIGDIIRRARANGPTGGWFEGVLENVHSGADDESSSIDPYNAGADAVPPYPRTVDPAFDIWLLGVSGQEQAAGNGLTMAIMGVNPPNHSQGWGRDDAGDPVVASPTIRIARFDGLDTATGITGPPMITEQGLVYQPVNMRLPRGCTITFESTSAGISVFRAIFLMGLFPAGLGQDVVA